MDNYKIKVNDEAESKEAQEMFFALGYKHKWDGAVVKESWTNARLVYAEDGILWSGNCSDDFEECDFQELSLPQLRDLVVLHRNDVKDANYLYGQRLVLKLETQDYKIWDLGKLEWVDHVGSQTDLRNGITRIQLPRTKDQGLISGADALRALADGQLVQWMTGDAFQDVTDEWQIREFSHPSFKFRLKPRTIKLELEIPAPIEGERQDNKAYWCFTEMQGIYWDSEEKFNQVVAALRGIKG